MKFITPQILLTSFKNQFILRNALVLFVGIFSTSGTLHAFPADTDINLPSANSNIGVHLFPASCLDLEINNESGPDKAVEVKPVVSANVDDALVISCPSDITIQCTASTLPPNTGNPIVTDPCDPTPTIAFYDYAVNQPSNGDEMRWVYLQQGAASGPCFSGTNCQNGTICIGLQYTPNVTGTLTSYTTGFLMNCFFGVNPIVSNTSCVMTNNGLVQEDCADTGLILMNSSGNSGAVPIQAFVPVILHQVCLQLGANGHIILDEDEATDLTASVEVQGGGLITQTPAYTNFDVVFNDYCTPGCESPHSIFRRFVVTDICNNLTTCVQQITIQDNIPPSLTCPPNITINYPASTNPTNTGTATAVDACSASPVVTYLDSLPGIICPFNNIIKRTWKAVDVCGNQATAAQYITINDRGTICGTVKGDQGQGLSGVQLNLYADLNNNQTQDGGDQLVMTTTTAANGSYCFSSVNPCQYVIVEIQPANSGSISDYDITPDPDGDDMVDGPDNQIPVNLVQLENDLDNNFIDLICPSILPTLPLDTICAGQSVSFQIADLNLGTLTYSWNFGSGSSPGTGSGLGPHTISYVTTTQNQASGASVVLSINKAGCTTLSGEVTHIEVNPYPNAAISTSATPICYYTNMTFQPVAPIIPGATYNWTFGVDAVPLTATGYGPHTVYYTSAAVTKTAKLVIRPNEAGAQCKDSSTVSFTVTNCPAQILGYVLSNTNQPIIGVTLKLYADNNPTDGVADNGVVLKSVTTSPPLGNYNMASLTPGSYVIVETQPNGWLNFNDFDNSDDGDLVANSSGLDNLIPVTLYPNEIDSMNNFIETALPGTITGSVFADYNGDMIPTPGEGINGVTLKLYTDNDANGVADNGTPVATQISNASGDYIFSSVAIGNYVLVETNLPGYYSVKDYDATNDGDAVINSLQDDDIIPVTMSNSENDANNYFLDLLTCPKMVTNTNNAGYGSLRFIINCVNSGDTISFYSGLSGQTIVLTSTSIDLNKNLFIISTLTPRVTITSSTLDLFKVFSNFTVEFRDLNIMGGDVVGAEGAAFENFGTLKLHNVNIAKNPSFPTVERLIRNQINSSLFLSGTCLLQQ